jgi:hypothetical protein
MTTVTITLLSQIRADTNCQARKGGSHDAHRLSRDKDSLVPERSNARNLLAAAAHLLRELVFDVRVGPRFDADCFRLGLGGEPRRVCLCLGFDAGALGDGFGGCDDGVCFCVGLGLECAA